jgi:ribose transport system permease protein
VITAFVLCATFSAVGGVLLTARVNSGQPNLGGDLALQSLAAVVIGGVSLFGGRGSIVGVAFGVIFISMLSNGLNLLSVPSYTQMIIIGTALILAVVLDNLIARRSGEVHQ